MRLRLYRGRVKLLLVYLEVKGYLVRVGSATSQLINVIFLLGDRPNESVSGRSYRMARCGSRRWFHTERFLNFIFGLFGDKDHCKNAYLNDVTEARLLIREYNESFYPTARSRP